MHLRVKGRGRKLESRHRALTAETVIAALEDAKEVSFGDCVATATVSRLFETETEHWPAYRRNHRPLSVSRDVIHAVFQRIEPVSAHPASNSVAPESGKKAKNVDFARCFMRLANPPNFALDRLSRYETNLWRQATRVLSRARNT
jgi:hypothetical protein